MKKQILVAALALTSMSIFIIGCSKDDEIAPVITINGDAEMIIGKGDTFNDPGATASDDEDGAITPTSDAATSVNVNVPDVYTVTYTATDKAGNVAIATRKVTVNWKGSQLAAFGYTASEHDSIVGVGVIDDSNISTQVQSSTISTYTFTYKPVWTPSTPPITANIFEGHHFNIPQQKPSGPGSTITIEGVDEGTISLVGTQIKIEFMVKVTDSTDVNDINIAYATLTALSL